MSAPKPDAARRRRLWLRLHRWISLALALPLMLVALLGSLLVLLKPLDQQWLNRALFQVPAGAQAPDLLERSRERLQAEFGAGSALTFRPPREPGESLRVIVRGAWRGSVYLDPRDARELGRRGEREGLYNLVFALHSHLLLDEAGKPLLALIALAYGLLLVAGLALWWPRRWPRPWTRAFACALDRGALRACFDLHRSGGVLLGLLIAVPVATGAYMAWKPLGAAVNAVAGRQPAAPPRLGDADADAPRVSLDAMVARAQQSVPGAAVGFVQWPGQAGRPLRVRLILLDDPHPNGLSSVWLHPRSGAVLALQRWDALDPGARANSVVYPLHTGELGGWAYESVNALLGLALVRLGGTGLWLWWRRR